MGLYVGCVVLDARDMKRAMEFWTAALGYEAKTVTDSWISLENPTRPWTRIGLQPNADPKSDVNRAHLDLWTKDLDAEVRRLEALGAKRIPWEYPEGANHVVLVDTEGNEFCVVDTSRPPPPPFANAGPA